MWSAQGTVEGQRGRNDPPHVADTGALRPRRPRLSVGVGRTIEPTGQGRARLLGAGIGKEPQGSTPRTRAYFNCNKKITLDFSRVIFFESLVVSVETAAIIVSSLDFWSGDINNDFAAINILAIHRFNCFFCLRSFGNCNESKTF